MYFRHLIRFKLTCRKKYWGFGIWYHTRFIARGLKMCCVALVTNVQSIAVRLTHQNYLNCEKNVWRKPSKPSAKTQTQSSALFLSSKMSLAFEWRSQIRLRTIKQMRTLNAFRWLWTWVRIFESGNSSSWLLCQMSINREKYEAHKDSNRRNQTYLN